MDLIRTIKEIPEKFIEVVNFFKQHIFNLILLTFKPQKFIKKFTWKGTDRKLLTESFFFLFTLVLFIRIIIEIIDRYSDAKISIDDVGLSTALLSGSLWNISWELVLYDLIPIVLLISGTGWLLTVFCFRDKRIQNKILILFPYVFWRSAMLLLFFLIVTLVCLLGLILLTSIFYDDIFLWILLIYQFILIPLGVTIIFLAIWKTKIFISNFFKENIFFKSRIRCSIFHVGIIILLLIPVWWSTVSLSPPASKVVINPEPIYSDTSDVTTVNVSLRNLSNQPLFTSNKGNVLSWWDDENPVYRRDFLFTTRVANGSFYLTTTEDRELSDRFKKFTYIGRESEAYLVPKSYSPYDFMGGPEIEYPTTEESDLARLSFREILNDRKKGRIDITIAVSTKGGRISNRKVTIHYSN